MRSRQGSSRRRVVVWVAGGVAFVAILSLITFSVLGGGGNTPSDPVDARTSEPPASGPPTTPDADPSSESTASGDESESENDETEPPDNEATDQPTRPTPATVEIDQAAEPADGVSVELISFEAIEATAAVPGEVSGPALAVTVAIENGSDDDILTSSVIVNLYYGPERTPANILVNPREEFPETLPAGESAQGRFAFTIAVSERSDVLIEVDLSLDMPVVLFEGEV